MLTQGLDAIQIRVVVQRAGRVIQGELPDLAIDPGPVDGHDLIPHQQADEIPASRRAHLLGAIGIAAQIASAYLYVFAAAFTVPAPAFYAFPVVWLVLVVLSVVWWRRRPLRSLLLPVASIPAVIVVLELGYRYLGWGP